MPPTVRSDHHVALKVRDADGKIHDLGQYQSQRISHVGWVREQREVPHLQRVSPDGRFLASYDVASSTLKLTPLKDGSATRRLRLKRKMTGTPLTFRWLSGGKQLVFATTHNVWVVKLNGKRTAIKQTKRLFKPSPKAASRITDVRTLSSGIMIRTRSYWSSHTEDRDLQPNRVYFVPSRRLGKHFDLAPKTHTAIGATTLAGGRIAVALRAGRKPAQIWLIDTRRGAPQVADKVRCQSSPCRVTNWVPNSQKLAYSLSDGTIVWEQPRSTSGAMAAHRLKIPKGRFLKVHTLWANAKETRLLAVNKSRLVVWDSAGRVVMHYASKGSDLIRSAAFLADGEGVVVAVGPELLTLRQGKVVKRWRVVHKKPVRRAEIFIDDVKVLSPGRVAYQIVTLRETRTWSRRRPRRLRLPMKNRILQQLRKKPKTQK